MFKKLISFLIIFFLLSGNIFAYSPTKSDQNYIDKVTTKIYYAYLKSPTKINTLVDKIHVYQKRNPNISERNKFILKSILLYIERLKMVLKPDNTVADESLSELLSSIDKLKGSSNDSFSKLFPEYTTIMKNTDYYTPPSTPTTPTTPTTPDNNNTTNDNVNPVINTPSNWDQVNFRNVYEVGPNKKYTELQDVPWESLQRSSIVKIYKRETPYYSKFVVNVAWTKDEPVVITWVPDENWALPIISWSNAITSKNLDYWNDERSIIKIGWSSTPSNETPSYIYIERLDIKNASPSYSFTDEDWNYKRYSDNAAWIHIEYGDNITIKNCNIHDNWNGIFSTHFSSNIVIAWNYIYDNWIVWSIYEHNTYTESKGITYEYNKFWKLKSWAGWNNLKDRSSNTVIRYNFIEWWNRQLDLVESDYQELINSSNYGKTYVYGNILIEPSDETGNSQFIHYGWDGSTTGNYRNWTLYLYNNTFVSYRNNNPTLVRMSLNSGKAEIINNVFIVKDWYSLAITAWAWQINLYNNYLPETWKDTFESNFEWQINQNSNFYSSNPWFVDLNNKDFHLIQDSILKNKANNLDSNFQKVEYQYKADQSITPRTTTNNVWAFE